MKIQDYLTEHIKKHPSVMPQDIVKFCYQAAFGAEHLLSDVAAARQYFDAEFDATSPHMGELVECLSNDIARVDLGSWKQMGLPKEWLFRMFVASTNFGGKPTSSFEELLCCVDGTLIKDLDFNLEEWHRCLEQYKAGGIRAVHHSEQYRNAEKPAYRLVDRRFLKMLDLLRCLSQIKKDGVKVIAIDGRAASGKTTLAELLSSVLNAETIHMDDFFLPPELRTRERLEEAGGNIHYERFCEEVIPFVGKNESFSYGVFDCSQMALNGKRAIPASEWRIVEGSYSHHPKFGDYADFKVFCTVSGEEQMLRILKRNGERMAELFRTRWIPMEETYFSAFKISDGSDSVFGSVG